MEQPCKRLIIGMSGASGSIYGWRLLERLGQRPDVETHLIMSRSAERTAHIELGKLAADFHALASHRYPVEDVGASIASGSYPVDAMVVAPCSIHTMSAIATGISSNLLVRAADVTLKERRRLILVVRETPFHLGHLRTMVALTEMGAIIARPFQASTISRRPCSTWWTTAWSASSTCFNCLRTTPSVGTLAITFKEVSATPSLGKPSHRRL